MKAPRFHLGRLFATPGATEALDESGQLALEFFLRHQSGDWGEVPPEDAQANERSVKERYRILSAYHTDKGVKLWVITEADRSSSTILLPDEY